MDLTIVVPTFNESPNVAELVSRLGKACRGIDCEVVFVDDSTDDTPRAIEAAAADAALPVRLIHRERPEGGLGGAVLHGIREARSEVCLVMDGDLQHPPEDVPRIYERFLRGDADVVVASRYVGDGEAAGLAGRLRVGVSRLATLLARALFPGRLRDCSDPMTGFFLVDRRRFDASALRPRGFKILLEILARQQLRVVEVPFRFAARRAGDSKASMRQGARFIGQVAALRFGGSPGPASAAAETTIAAALALVSFLIACVGIAIPSFWYDEAASYSGAARSPAELWRMTGEVDAVHGLFYLLMHPIVAVAGPDPFAMRAPAAVAVALTVAAVYLLARRFGPRLSSFGAALLFLGLARTSWMETEARSFALATLVATVLTLLLVRALGSDRRGWPVAYGLLALFGIHLYAFTTLVVVAHAVTVALGGAATAGGAATGGRAVKRRRAALWIAMAAAGLLSAPLLLEVASQRGQLGGTFEIGARTWLHVFVSELFHLNVAQAIAAWGILLVAIVVLAWRWMRLRMRLRPGAGTVLLPWLLLPTAAVVIFSWISPTIYQPRALVVCAPAFCVLLAELLRRAFRPWVSLAAAVVIAAIGVSSFVGYRELTVKGSDWPLASAELAARAEPGDAVVYSKPVDYHTWPSLMRIMYPDRLAGLDDIALVTPFRERAALFDERSPVGSLGPALASVDRVWYVSPAALDDEDRAPDLAALEAAGLEPASFWAGPRTTIQEWRRAGVAP